MNEAAPHGGASSIPVDEHRYTECYVAFVDFLGWKDSIKKSASSGELLGRIAEILRHTAELNPTDHSKRNVKCEGLKCVSATDWKMWRTQIRSFSDCVTIFIPTEADALSDVLCKVRFLHDRALELGFCIRGAVTIGEMLWNDAWSGSHTGQTRSDSVSAAQSVLYDRSSGSNAIITVGPALVEAHELETTVACYPRVILSTKLIEHVSHMRTLPPENAAQGIHKAAAAGFLCAPKPENHGRCLLDFIRTDFDGVPFLDTFHPDILRDDTTRIIQEVGADGSIRTRWERDGGTTGRIMPVARKRIMGWLAGNLPDKVRIKYLWLANYYNNAAARQDMEQIPVSWVPDKGVPK